MSYHTPGLSDDTPRNNAGNTRGRPFAPGNPGRPAGARHKSTVLAETLLAGEAEELMRAAVDMAVGGHPGALRLCLDRLVPLRRERTVAVDLPVVETAADAVRAAGQLAALVGAGKLTPGEGRSLAAIIETQRRVIEARDVERRVVALEEAVRFLRGQPAEAAPAGAAPAPAAADGAAA